MNSKRSSTRRDFLAGRAAVDAISDLLPGEPEGADAAGQSARLAADSQPADRACLVEVSRQAMACTFRVVFEEAERLTGTEAALQALDLVERLEDQMTVFRDHSEICEINRTAAERPIRVESRLFQLLCQAAALHQATAGAFDITAGPLWKTWGFHRRAGRFPSQQEVASALLAVGSQWLQLDRAAETIRFAHPETELNLGSIGKGYALDRCQELLTAAGISNFAIHGGMSSIIARGACPGSSPGSQDAWPVIVRHPLHSDRQLVRIWLLERALATSGSANQFFHFEGQRYAHVIDPRTGFPADQLLSATVLAPTAAEADALSTAFFVMGADEAGEFCAHHPQLAAVLIGEGTRAGEVAIRVHGLAETEWEQLS